jgi:hypothetical protein
MQRASLAIVLVTQVTLGVSCSSASSNGTLSPGQLDADGVPSTDARPPSGGVLPPSSPPNSTGPSAQCPSFRGPATTNLEGANDVRARLVGIYRSCSSSFNGLEVRIDPESETGLVWYLLDERFVRTSAGNGTLDIAECDGSRCAVTWTAPYPTEESEQPHILTVWSEPTAITIETDPPNGENGNEWLRIAD